MGYLRSQNPRPAIDIPRLNRLGAHVLLIGVLALKAEGPVKVYTDLSYRFTILPYNAFSERILDSINPISSTKENSRDTRPHVSVREILSVGHFP